MRQFLIRCSYTILPLLLTIYGLTFYYWHQVSPYEAGDLGVLGKLSTAQPGDFDSLAKNRVPERFLRTSNLPKGAFPNVDILIFGDSFSKRAHPKPNYVQQMALRHGYSILVVESLLESADQTAIAALNSGWIDSIGPKVVLIQSVGRSFAQRLIALDFNHSDPKIITSNERNKKQLNQVDYIFQARNWALLQLPWGLGQNPVIKSQLYHPCFNSSRPNQLLYYKDDIKKLSLTSKERCVVVDNLLKLKESFKGKHYQMLYIVAADKYDIYSPYIMGNKHPHNTTIDSVVNDSRVAPFFINSKKILRAELLNGVKDIYDYGDSHWGTPASIVIADSIERRLNLLSDYTNFTILGGFNQ